MKHPPPSLGWYTGNARVQWAALLVPWRQESLGVNGRCSISSLLPPSKQTTALKGTAACSGNPHPVVASSIWRSIEYYLGYMHTTASAHSLHYTGLLKTPSILVQKWFSFSLRLQWCQHHVHPPKHIQLSSLPNTLGIWRANREMDYQCGQPILTKLKGGL